MAITNGMVTEGMSKLYEEVAQMSLAPCYIIFSLSAHRYNPLGHFLCSVDWGKERIVLVYSLVYKGCRCWVKMDCYSTAPLWGSLEEQ